MTEPNIAIDRIVQVNLLLIKNIETKDSLQQDPIIIKVNNIWQLQQLVVENERVNLEHFQLLFKGKIITDNATFEKLFLVKEEAEAETVVADEVVEIRVELLPDGWKTRSQTLDSMTTILQEITNIHSEIHRLYTEMTAVNIKVKCFEYSGSYVVDNETGKAEFAVKEEAIEVESQIIIDEFKPRDDSIKPVKDYFNDKINYQVENVKDLLRLSNEMFPVASKYVELFEENSRKMQAILHEFLGNYIGIYSSLWTLKGKLKDAVSNLAALQHHEASINYNLTKLFEQNVQFKKPFFLVDTMIKLTKAESEELNKWFPNQEVKLLYRRSRDGADSINFHTLCDNQGPTLILIHSVNGFVFGGYTTASWVTNNQYVPNPGGYLFTLRNPHNLPPTKFFITNNIYGIYTDDHYGPTFGGGHDLYVDADMTTINFNLGHSYTNTSGKPGNTTFAGSSSCQIEELEVWKVK